MFILFFSYAKVGLGKIEEDGGKKSYLRTVDIEILMKISSCEALHFCSMPNNEISIFD